MDEILINSIIIYIFILVLLYVIKPKFIYNKKTKSFKPFGFDCKTTSFIPYPVLCVLLAIFIYLLCLMYSKTFN